MEGGCGRRQDTAGILAVTVAALHTSNGYCVISNQSKTDFTNTERRILKPFPSRQQTKQLSVLQTKVRVLTLGTEYVF